MNGVLAPPGLHRRPEWVSMSRRYAPYWRCWEKTAPLNFKGEHYNFTLMTPAFSPPPTGLPMVPVTIAAVGPAMLRLAGRHCDGVRLHAFCTRAYAEQVVVPEIEKGLSNLVVSARTSKYPEAGSSSPEQDEASLAQEFASGFGSKSASMARRPLISRSWNCVRTGDLAKKLNKLVRNGDLEKLAARYRMMCSIYLLL